MTTSGDPKWPAGWPDAAALERLANEFFSAPLGVDPLGVDPLGVDPLESQVLKGDIPLAGRAPGVSPPAISLPGEAELQALLSSIPSWTVPTAPSPPATASSFYFL